jgi:hypothetical protein
VAGTTHTGDKLHRLAGQIADLPDAAMIVVAKKAKQLVEDEARAGGVGTMTIAGRARGPRQEGPTRARRPVRLRAKDTFKAGTGQTSLRIQAVPIGPWVWANTGTDAHYVGRLKGRGPGRGAAGPARVRGAWVRGAGYSHGVVGPVLHPGTAGRQVWRKAAVRVVAATTVTFRDELHARVVKL